MKKAPDKVYIEDSGAGRRLKSFAYNAKVAPYVFIAPFVIVFLVFYVYPIISGFVMSFQNVVPGQTKFVGWKNYKILTNREFKKAIRNSVVYTVATLITLLPIPQKTLHYKTQEILLLQYTSQDIYLTDYYNNLLHLNNVLCLCIQVMFQLSQD